MRLSEFNASIRAIHQFFLGENFLESTSYIVSLPRLDRFNKICLTSSSYVDIYESGLSLSHYNFILKDLAYFQFSYSSQNEWALAYYPNPRVSGSADALVTFNELKDAAASGEIDDEEFSSLASSLPIGNYIPRVRFEYSETQYKPVKHPGAHFHIGMAGEDRWASSRKISPKSFGLVITKHYYPDIWWKKSRFSLPARDQESVGDIDNCLDQKLFKSIQDDGVSHSFSDFESLTFHFGAMQPAPANH